MIIRSANRWSVALILALTLAGCSPAVLPSLIRPGRAPGAPTTVIVLSARNTVLTTTMDAFLDAFDGGVIVFDLEGNSPSNLVDKVESIKPTLIFALGAPAALLMRDKLPTVPTMFANVLNYKQHRFQDRPNIFGIAAEPSLLKEFMQFKMISPDTRRVLTFYARGQSEAAVQEARAALPALGIELVAVPVSTTAEIITAYENRAKGVDGIWLMNDPAVVTRPTFMYLKDQAVKDKLPFFTSFSGAFARAGALMSASVDLKALGSQAAAMAGMFLKGKTPAQIGVKGPIGGRLVVNLTVAERIGLQIPADVRPFINEIVR